MSLVAGTSWTPGHLEVLLTSESTGQLWNCALWDPQTGASLATYKGAITAPQTLTRLGDTFLVSAQPHKPVLNVWLAHRHEQQPQKITTPAPLNALCATPTGQFMVGAAGDRIYVWQTCNGRLHKVLSAHFQPVTRLAFTSDGSHFVSAGQDGHVLAWHLLDVVTVRNLPGQRREPSEAPMPVHSWTDHKLAVTDLHISPHGIRSRVFTASLDRTAKVYCLLTGHLLLDLSFATPLTSVSVDPAEVNVFLGAQGGPIHTFCLLNPPRDLQVTVEAQKGDTFTGHTAQVTQLSVSLDGSTLASGSEDQSVRLWDIKSKQTTKIITHKGPLTHVEFLAPLRGMLDPDRFRQNLMLSNLQKTSFESDKMDFFVRERFEPLLISEATSGADVDQSQSMHPRNGTTGEGSDDLEKLKRINQELYQFAVKKILSTSTA